VADRRLRLEIIRLSDDVLIVLVQDDPESKCDVEPRTTFFCFRDFHGKSLRRGRLTGDRKQHQHVSASRSGDPHAYGHRTRFAALGLATLGFTHP
jgi:hypothetical protein